MPRLFIDGNWIEASDNTFTVTSPVDGRKIGTFPIADREHVSAAIDAASSAKEKWRLTPAHERAKLLFALAREIHQIAAGEASKNMTLEMGKPISSAASELEFAEKIVVQTAEDLRRIETAFFQSENPALRVFTLMEPFGVFAIIAPWNFPYLTPLLMLCPALAAGNTVVFKPAEQTPLAGQILTECFEKAGFPRGVINLVQGPGEITGETLTSTNKLDGVGFTGSIATGRRLAAKQAEHLVHFVFELGGNGPIIVLENADLSSAAIAVVESCYSNSGQDCQAGERILVLDSVHDEFVHKVIEETKNWKVGDPLKRETRMGPLVEEAVASKVDRHISEAITEGARIRAGGGRASGYPTPLYYQATVLDEVSPDMLIAKEETFGPVCPIIKCQSVDAAVEIANSGEYGLASSVFTKDAKIAMRLCETIKTGEVVINYPSTSLEPSAPFGGMRKSGLGRIFGRHGIASFSQVKTVLWNLG